MSEISQSMVGKPEIIGEIPEMKLEWNSTAAGEVRWQTRSDARSSIQSRPDLYRNAFTADVSSSLTSNTV
jgi:hypothetical protein